MEEDTGRRATRIYRDWRRASFQPARGILWRTWNFSAINSQIVVCIAFMLPDLEYVFWGSDRWHWALKVVLAWHHPTGLGAAIFLIYPVNILLIENYLNLRTPRRRLVRPLLLRARALASGVPILGLHMIPGWRWLLQHRSVWVYRDESREGPIPFIEDDRPSARWRHRLGGALHRARSSLFFIAWLGSVNIVAVHLATSDLSASPWMTPSYRLIACILLHLLGFACTASFLLAQHRQRPLTRRKLVGLWLVTGLWFLPQPFAFLSLLVFVLARDGWGREATILGGIDSSSRSTEVLKQEVKHYWQRQSLWHRWRGPWGLEKEQEVLDSERRLAAFCRGKTLLLVVDGVAITQFVIGFALNNPAGILIALLLQVIVIISMMVSIVSLFLVMGGRALRAIRFGIFSNNHSQNPGLDYLLLTQSALIAGVFLGIPLALDWSRWLAFALVLVGGMYILFDFFGVGNIGIGKWEDWGERMFWAGIFFQMVGAGYFMVVYPWVVDLVQGTLRWIAGGFLVWSLLLGLFHSSALLYPASWRELLSSRLSKGTRWLMAIMLASAWVPLGGLMIPLWFYGRKRLPAAAMGAS